MTRERAPTTATLEALRHLVRAAKEDSAILDAPALEFFRRWLEEDLRATIPAPRTTTTTTTDAIEIEDDEAMAAESDDLSAIAMGAETAPETPGEAEEAKASEAKRLASEAFAREAWEEAIERYTEALMIAPSALTYAKRAECFIKLRKPLSAIRDGTAALKLNPDSAKALKVRGAAHRYLGHWNEANADLSAGLSQDFDETYGEMHKKVLSVVHELHVREGKARAAKEAKEREELEKRRAAAEAARKEAAAKDAGGPGFGQPGAGFPGGAGDLPPGVSPEMAQKLMSDPDLVAAMQNPKVMQALQTMMKNPMAAMQYMSDPEVGPVLQKLMASMGGAMPGGAPGGFPGSFPGGFPGAGAAPGGAANDVD